MEAFHHQSVMPDEVIEWLDVGPGGNYCDGTVGGAGHARRILERSAPSGWLLGLDRDPEAVVASKTALAGFDGRVRLEKLAFAELPALASREGLPKFDGILLDLGVSSHQLDQARRGFSFRSTGPLDMRMDPCSEITAAELVNNASERELAQLLRRFGEVPSSRRVARALKACCRGTAPTTTDLARSISEVLGTARGSPKTHPATRVFQALRIAVNGELAQLEAFLETFTELLAPAGRLVVISFHSLEDRLVKRHLRQLARPCSCPPDLPQCVCGRLARLRLLTSRPVRPSMQELSDNPRARSAKLRAAQRIETQR